MALGLHDEPVLALNYATLGIVDEILWLPSPAVASTAVTLLYGTATKLPEDLLAHVGRGVPASAASLVVDPRPLATLIPSRLATPTVWRARRGDVKEARGLARQRYRELQAWLMTGGRVSCASAGSLMRHIYGTRGRWSWREAAHRILDRVVTLNRAALRLLVARPRSLSRVPLQHVSVLPERALGILAEVLAPVVVPDFSRFAQCLSRVAPVLDGEESIERYQSLFAELLSVASHQGEVRA
jgi:hypothetical protein